MLPVVPGNVADDALSCVAGRLSVSVHRTIFDTVLSLMLATQMFVPPQATSTGTGPRGVVDFGAGCSVDLGHGVVSNVGDPDARAIVSNPDRANASGVIGLDGFCRVDLRQSIGAPRLTSRSCCPVAIVPLLRQPPAQFDLPRSATFTDPRDNYRTRPGTADQHLRRSTRSEQNARPIDRRRTFTFAAERASHRQEPIR